MTQLDFLSAPYQAHSETSREAAEFIAPKIGPLQQKVLSFIRDNGPVTDAQIIEGMGLAPNSIRPRRIELLQAGRVRQHSIVKQLNGRRATAWVTTERDEMNRIRAVGDSTPNVASGGGEAE